MEMGKGTGSADPDQTNIYKGMVNSRQMPRHEARVRRLERIDNILPVRGGFEAVFLSPRARTAESPDVRVEGGRRRSWTNFRIQDPPQGRGSFPSLRLLVISAHGNTGRYIRKSFKTWTPAGPGPHRFHVNSPKTVAPGERKRHPQSTT